jgi:hypothetical protein
VAFGARGYLRQRWNVFDFVLVVGTSVGPAVGLPSVTSLLRVFRVLRAVRLVRGSRGMVQVCVNVNVHELQLGFPNTTKNAEGFSKP